MNKLRSLRTFLLSSVPDLARDPDRLLTFIDKGKPISRGPSLSFEYDYQANIILTDYSGDLDAVMVPLQAWYKTNQPDILVAEGISFEADVLSHDAVDLSITLKLTEAVVVTTSNGEWTAEHQEEPEPEQYTGLLQTVFLKGEPL